MLENVHTCISETYRPGHSPAGQTLTKYYSNIIQILTTNVKFDKTHVGIFQGRHFLRKKKPHRTGVGVGGIGEGNNTYIYIHICTPSECPGLYVP